MHNCTKIVALEDRIDDLCTPPAGPVSCTSTDGPRSKEQPRYHAPHAAAVLLLFLCNLVSVFTNRAGAVGGVQQRMQQQCSNRKLLRWWQRRGNLRGSARAGVTVGRFHSSSPTEVRLNATRNHSIAASLLAYHAIGVNWLHDSTCAAHCCMWPARTLENVQGMSWIQQSRNLSVMTSFSVFPAVSPS